MYYPGIILFIVLFRQMLAKESSFLTIQLIIHYSWNLTKNTNIII
jgi:hypothetical protein